MNPGSLCGKSCFVFYYIKNNKNDWMSCFFSLMLSHCCFELKYPRLYIGGWCFEHLCYLPFSVFFFFTVSVSWLLSLFFSSHFCYATSPTLPPSLFLSLSPSFLLACLSHGCHLPEGACNLRFSERDQVSKKFKECKLPTAHFSRPCLCKNVIFTSLYF